MVAPGIPELKSVEIDFNGEYSIGQDYGIGDYGGEEFEYLYLANFKYPTRTKPPYSRDVYMGSVPGMGLGRYGINPANDIGRLKSTLVKHNIADKTEPLTKEMVIESWPGLKSQMDKGNVEIGKFKRINPDGSLYVEKAPSPAAGGCGVAIFLTMVAVVSLMVYALL